MTGVCGEDRKGEFEHEMDMRSIAPFFWMVNAFRAKRVRGLLLLGLLALQGCLGTTWAEYPVKDSGRVANSDVDIYWLDNRRVLFQGHFLNADGSINDPGGIVKNSETLYEWDIESGTLIEHGDIGGGLCYANGYVRYWRPKESQPDRTKADTIAGEIGKQTRIDLENLPIDRETCKPRNDSPLPEWTRGKRVVRLKSEHGFLVLGPEKQDSNTPVTYHPKGVEDGVVMPFKRREAFFAFVKYSPFKDAYFIVGHYFRVVEQHPDGGYGMSWPRDVSIPVWWVYTDGRVEEIRLPSESRFGAAKIFAAKPGVFFISPGHNVNMDGLFVVSESKVKRILKGFIERYAVSPDGCKIAINHDQNYTGRQGRGTLKIIDVCGGRNWHVL